VPSVVQIKKKRGRPKKRYAPLGVSVSTFVQITSWSRSKVFDEMAAGRLAYAQSKPGSERNILSRELIRLGFVKDLRELIAVLAVKFDVPETAA
jgi:hypothetical protein